MLIPSSRAYLCSCYVVQGLSSESPNNISGLTVLICVAIHTMSGR